MTLFTRQKLSGLPTNKCKAIYYIFVISNVFVSYINDQPLLCESLFSVISFSNLEMQNVGISYYQFLNNVLLSVDCDKIFLKNICLTYIMLKMETLEFAYIFCIFCIFLHILVFMYYKFLVKTRNLNYSLTQLTTVTEI